jgi:uncharacterized protein (DUF1330 family)
MARSAISTVPRFQPPPRRDQCTVVVEFDSLAQAISAYDSPGYQAALAVLGHAAERDLRIVEGVDG